MPAVDKTRHHELQFIQRGVKEMKKITYNSSSIRPDSRVMLQQHLQQTAIFPTPTASRTKEWPVPVWLHPWMQWFLPQTLPVSPRSATGLILVCPFLTQTGSIMLTEILQPDAPALS